MRILVTGANGYLGAQILRLAGARSISICGTARRSSPGLLTCDLRDTRAVTRLIAETKTQTVIHCAARVPKADIDYNDADRAAENLAMVDALVTAKPQRIVFASSMTVYGPTTPFPAHEEAADGGTSIYSKAKLAAEHRLTTGVPEATSLRFTGLFGGPRRSGVLHAAIQAYCEGRMPSLSTEFPLWSALHVEDAAELCFRAALRPVAASGAINAGYPGSMSITKAICAIARRFDRPIPVMPTTPEFEMDLSRLSVTLGLPSANFDERIDAMCRDAQLAA